MKSINYVTEETEHLIITGTNTRKITFPNNCKGQSFQIKKLNPKAKVTLNYPSNWRSITIQF
jgi:hypothetical protein